MNGVESSNSKDPPISNEDAFHEAEPLNSDDEEGSEVDEEEDYSDEDDEESSNSQKWTFSSVSTPPMEVPFPSAYIKRDPNPSLPDTVTVLKAPDGCIVYLVGTAHYSESSQEDVAKTIQATQPDIVVVELCKSRVNILALDEETLLREAKDINMQKIQQAIKESGVVQGLLHLLLLNLSAYVTKELGMAPGGEFRRALKEAVKIVGCRMQLGDRPIQVTLRRALGSLTVWQKVRLGWHLLSSKDPISKEDVERCKQRDVLEELLREMTGEFPAISRVFITERDQFLAQMLRMAAKPVPKRDPDNPDGVVPSVVVGVVGIGHVSGIVENWDKECDLSELLKIPPPSLLGYTIKLSIRVSMLSLLAWGSYKLFRVARTLI